MDLSYINFSKFRCNNSDISSSFFFQEVLFFFLLAYSFLLTSKFSQFINNQITFTAKLECGKSKQLSFKLKHN